MVRQPIIATRTRSIIVQTAYVIIVALLGGFIFALFHAPQVGALSLPQVSVGLPLSDTPLAPVTNTVDKITSSLLIPVTLQNTPDTIDANVNLGQLPIISQPESPPAEVNLSVPMPMPTAEVLPSINRTVNQVIPSTNSAQQNTPLTAQTTAPSIESPQTPPSSQQPAEKTSVAGAVQTDDVPTAEAVPFFAAVGNLLGLLPAPVQSLVHGVGRESNIFPIIISAGIFGLLLASIFSITYLAEHSRLIANGNNRLAQFAQTHDLTQLSVFAVTLIGAVVIAVYLELTFFDKI